MKPVEDRARGTAGLWRSTLQEVASAVKELSASQNSIRQGHLYFHEATSHVVCVRPVKKYGHIIWEKAMLVKSFVGML